MPSGSQDSPQNDPEQDHEMDTQNVQKHPEDFDVKAFHSDLKDLHHKLQSDRFKQLDNDFTADKLDDMVDSVTKVMENFKSYTEYTGKHLDEVRITMHDIKERVYKKINNRPYEARSKWTAVLQLFIPLLPAFMPENGIRVHFSTLYECHMDRTLHGLQNMQMHTSKMHANDCMGFSPNIY